MLLTFMGTYRHTHRCTHAQTYTEMHIHTYTLTHTDAYTSHINTHIHTVILFEYLKFPSVSAEGISHLLACPLAPFRTPSLAEALSPIVWQHSTLPQLQIHPDSTHICPSLALLPAKLHHDHFLTVPLDKAQPSQAPLDGLLLHSSSPLLTLCSGHLELIPAFTESPLSHFGFFHSCSHGLAPSFIPFV